MFLGGCGMDQNRDQQLTNFYSLPQTAAWGGVALFAVIFYASGIPRVQRDLLQVRRNPYLGEDRYQFTNSHTAHPLLRQEVLRQGDPCL